MAHTKNLSKARLYIKSSFNNTIVTLTDAKGATVAWASSGNVGFKGAKKSTPFAASKALDKILDSIRNLGIKKLSVYIKGPGMGRDAALRFLRGKKDLEIDMISDITPIPHNGPRPPKQRKG